MVVSPPQCHPSIPSSLSGWNPALQSPQEESNLPQSLTPSLPHSFNPSLLAHFVHLFLSLQTSSNPFSSSHQRPLISSFCPSKNYTLSKEEVRISRCFCRWASRTQFRNQFLVARKSLGLLGWCWCYAVQCNALYYSAVQFIILLFSAMHYITVQWSAVQCITVHYSTVQRSGVKASNLQSSPVQCKVKQ